MRPTWYFVATCYSQEQWGGGVEVGEAESICAISAATRCTNVGCSYCFSCSISLESLQVWRLITSDGYIWTTLLLYNYHRRWIWTRRMSEGILWRSALNGLVCTSSDLAESERRLQYGECWRLLINVWEREKERAVFGRRQNRYSFSPRKKTG